MLHILSESFSFTLILYMIELYRSAGEIQFGSYHGRELFSSWGKWGKSGTFLERIFYFPKYRILDAGWHRLVLGKVF